MGRRARVDRTQIVALAMEMAEQGGLAAISLTTIAARLDLRIPSLYNHIAGMEDLQREVVLVSLTKANVALREAAIGRAGDDAIRAMAAAYRAFAHDHPGWYDAVQAALRFEDEEVMRQGDEIVHTMLAVLEAYGMHGDDAIHMVRILRSVFHGFVSLELGGGFGMPLDLNESYRRLIDLILAGLHHSDS
jgi:AcrR family transcriptional regulator